MLHTHSQDNTYSVYSYALLQASFQADVEAVTDCIEHGAYLEVTDPEGRTPLMLASGRPYAAAIKIVDLLLACEANVAHHDTNNNTAAHLASAAGNDHILAMLKAAGAPLDIGNMNHDTPLHLAKDDKVTAILLGYGARCYLENKQGNTPLLMATIRHDADSMETLLQYGSKAEHRNRGGFNAAAVAWRDQYVKGLHCLYRYGDARPATDATEAAQGSPEFEKWLSASLRDTPEALRTPVELQAPSPVEALRGVVFQEGEELRPYFQMEELEAALKKPMDADQPRFLKQMRERGNLRVLKQVPDTFDFSGMRQDFPNFDKVSDFLEQQVELCRLSSKKIAAFQPLLLLGDPGVGKTRYLWEVSRLMNLEFSLVQCGGVSANFVMSGSSTSWKNGKPGKIHTTLRDGKTINPILMLDEIDKLAGSADYDAHGPLYQLLEKKTAEAFQDECIEVPMDCSRFIWIATANHIHLIPDAIVSRLVVIDVPTPSGEALQRVAQSIYRDIRKENGDTWGLRFSEGLSQDVLECIDDLTPREIRKRLLSACGNAAFRGARQGNFAGMIVLQPDDLGSMPTSHRARPMGFGSR